MREFAQKSSRIEKLSTEAKIIYTAFLVFSLAAMLVSVLYYMSLVGGRAFDGATEYYAGQPAYSDTENNTKPLSSDGPTIELPEEGPSIELPEDGPSIEESAERPSSPMLLSVSWRKLLEVTHFHLFTLPVFLLIIAHIFMLCGLPPRVRILGILSGVFSSALHMAAPWLIFYGGASWAWLMPITGTWMTLSMLLLLVWPGWEMWRPRSKKR